MRISKSNIEGLLIIEPAVFQDKRGYFFESYNEKVFHYEGIKHPFVQDNQSKSSYGTIRGLHMQKAPYEQTKLIRVLDGKILDVAVDLRKNSPTYKQWYSLEISEENKLQLLIPKGFCHGFSVLSESATVFYKCDELYNPESEAGIRYNDHDLNIDWKVPAKDILVSDKDSSLPSLSELL